MRLGNLCEALANVSEALHLTQTTLDRFYGAGAVVPQGRTVARAVQRQNEDSAIGEPQSTSEGGGTMLSVRNEDRARTERKIPGAACCAERGAAGAD